MAPITELGAQRDSGLVNGSRNSDFYGVKSKATAIHNADFTALCSEDNPGPRASRVHPANLESGRFQCATGNKVVLKKLITLRQM